MNQHVRFQDQRPFKTQPGRRPQKVCADLAKFIENSDANLLLVAQNGIESLFKRHGGSMSASSHRSSGGASGSVVEANPKALIGTALADHQPS